MQNSPAGKTALGLDLNVGALLTNLPVCGINLIYSIIVLVTDKTNKIVRFYAMQSLLLLVAAVVVFVGLTIISMILGYISAMLGLLFSLLFWVVLLAFLGIAIFLCVKSYSLQMFKLPIIGDMADKWSN
jgi:uncharacterized membrane protein